MAMSSQDSSQEVEVGGDIDSNFGFASQNQSQLTIPPPLKFTSSTAAAATTTTTNNNNSNNNNSNNSKPHDDKAEILPAQIEKIISHNHTTITTNAIAPTTNNNNITSTATTNITAVNNGNISFANIAAVPLEYENYQRSNTTLSISNAGDTLEQTNDEIMIPRRIDFKKYLINPDRQIPRRSSFTDVEHTLKAETSTISIPKRERQCISLPRSQVKGTCLLESPDSNVNTLSYSSHSSCNDSPESSSSASSQEICITTASSQTSDTSASTSPTRLGYRLSESVRPDHNMSNQISEMTKQERLSKSNTPGNTPQKNKDVWINKADNIKGEDSSKTKNWNERHSGTEEKEEHANGYNENINTTKKYSISATTIAAALSNSNIDIRKTFNPIPLLRRSNQDIRNSPKLTLKTVDSYLLQEGNNAKETRQCTSEDDISNLANMLDKTSSSDTVPTQGSQFNINHNQSKVDSPFTRKKENVVKVRPKPQTRTSVDKLANNAPNKSNENSVKFKTLSIQSENRSFASDTSCEVNNFTPPSPLKQTLLKNNIEQCSGLASEDITKTKTCHRSTDDKQHLSVSPNRHISSDSSSIPIRNMLDSRASRGITTPTQDPAILCNKTPLNKFPYPEAAPLKNTRLSTSVPISPVQTTRLQSEGSKLPVDKPERPSKPSHTTNTKGSRIPISKSTRSAAPPLKPNRLVMNRLTNPYGGLRLSSENISTSNNLPPSNVKNVSHQFYPDNSCLVAGHSFLTPPISEVTHKRESKMFKKKVNRNEYFESTVSDQSAATIATATTITIMKSRAYIDEEETYSDYNMKQTNLDEIESPKVSSHETIPQSSSNNSLIRSSSCEVEVGSPTKTSPTTSLAAEIPMDISTEISHTGARQNLTTMATIMLNQENCDQTNKNYHDTATLTTCFKETMEERKETYTRVKQDAAAQTSEFDLYEENFDTHFQSRKEHFQFRHDAAAQTSLETGENEGSPEENGADTQTFEFASTSSLTASIPINTRQVHHHIKMGGAALKTRPSSEMVEVKQQKCCNTNYLYQNTLEPSRSVDQIQQIVFMEEGQARLYDLKPAPCQNVHIISPNKSYISSYSNANSQEFSLSTEQNVMKPSYVDHSQAVFTRPELKSKLSNSLASGLNESLYSSSDSYIFHSNNSLKETTYSEFEPRRRRTASLSNIAYEKRMDCRKNQKRSRISAFFDKFHRKKKPAILANDVDVPTHFRVIGRILEMCLDGTRIIELTQPPHGLCGIYMTRVKHNLGYSIYVSRFSDGYPAKMFAGLLSIGDEILEINGISTGCMTIEDAHDMVASCDKLILRVLPDINAYRKTLM